MCVGDFQESVYYWLYTTFTAAWFFLGSLCRLTTVWREHTSAQQRLHSCNCSTMFWVILAESMSQQQHTAQHAVPTQHTQCTILILPTDSHSVNNNMWSLKVNLSREVCTFVSFLFSEISLYFYEFNYCVTANIYVDIYHALIAIIKHSPEYQYSSKRLVLWCGWTDLKQTIHHCIFDTFHKSNVFWFDHNIEITPFVWTCRHFVSWFNQVSSLSCIAAASLPAVCCSITSGRLLLADG